MGRPWMGERLAKGTASRARALERIRSWGRWTQAFVRESREEMWVRREVAYDSIVRLIDGPDECEVTMFEQEICVVVEVMLQEIV
jgi:hypothetical protein